MDAETTSIFNLGRKPLQKIVSYLNMAEKLKLVVIDQCFVNMLEGYLADSLIDMTFIQEHFSVAEAKDILSICGYSIKRIRLEVSMKLANDEYPQLVTIYCPNLEEIELIGLEVTHLNTYAKLLGTSKRVSILRMKKCIVSNAGCLVISKLSQLKTLDLQDSKLAGNHLNALRNLVHLSLRHCRSFKSKNLILICKGTKLKTLNITHCKQLSYATFKKLTEVEIDLQSLTVTNEYCKEGYQTICNLVNLRELSMRHCEQKDVARYLKELVEGHKDILQSLDIHFGYHRASETVEFMEREILNRIMEFRNLRALCLPYCLLLKNADLLKMIKSCPDLEVVDIGGSTFTDNGIIACVENLDRLEFFDISYCNVEKRLYHSLVEIRQEKGCREQLTVFIKQDTMLANCLKADCYEEYKNVVRLSSEPMRTFNDTGLLQQIVELKKNSIGDLVDECPMQRNTIRLVNTPSIVNIDDYCIHRIMFFLNFTEKLLLVLSSNCFDQVFRHILHLEVFDLPIISQHFTIREIRIILQRFGSSIRKLQLRASNYYFDIEYNRLAAKYCTKVKELYCKSVDEETVKEILVSSSKTLSIVKLIDGRLDDEVLQRISELNNLKVLHLKGTDATGNHLGSLSQLVELDLMGSSHFQSDNFEAICKGNKLKCLNIHGCEQLNDTAFRTLVHTQTDLERLTLGNSYKANIIDDVAKLRNLIDFRLHECHFEHIERYLNSLIEHRCDQLQVLEIEYLQDFARFEFLSALTENVARRLKENILEFNNLIYLSLSENTIVDNDYVKKLAHACPQLEILNFCSSIRLPDEGIVTIIEKLKNLKHFDINSCNMNNALLTYEQILEILKKRIASPLTLYLEVDHVLHAFTMTREYEVTKKHLVLSKGSIRHLDIEKYRRERLRSVRTTTPVSRVQAESNNKTTLRPSIMHLPSSCLSHVMSYLDTTNQLKLALLDDRFYHLMQPWINNAVFDMNTISPSFTLSEAQQILAKFANHVRRIHFVTSIQNLPLDYFNLIKPYFPQLIEIEINNCHEHFFQATEELFASTRHLEIAKFQNCYHNDELLPFLCNNKQLKVLEVSHSSITGEHIKNFVNLVDLNLKHCYNIRSEHFLEVLRSCKLKTLDIRNCYCLNEEAFDLLVDRQIDLERLSITTLYNSKHLMKLCQLQNLKHIRIDNNTHKSEIQSILDELLQYRRDDLLSLVLHNNANVTIDYCFYDVVQRRIEKFRNLQNVEIYQEPIYSNPNIWD